MDGGQVAGEGDTHTGKLDEQGLRMDAGDRELCNISKTFEGKHTQAKQKFLGLFLYTGA